jgi:hypothetical protein
MQAYIPQDKEFTPQDQQGGLSTCKSALWSEVERSYLAWQVNELIFSSFDIRVV